MIQIGEEMDMRKVFEIEGWAGVAILGPRGSFGVCDVSWLWTSCNHLWHVKRLGPDQVDVARVGMRPRWFQVPQYISGVGPTLARLFTKWLPTASTSINNTPMDS